MIGHNGKPLPCDTCGGKCCFYAPIEMKVWEKHLKKKIGADAIVQRVFEGTKKEAVVVSKVGTDGECYFLREGRCSVYTYRPETCRRCGVAFPCTEIDPGAFAKMVFEMRKAGHRFIADGADK